MLLLCGIAVAWFINEEFSSEDDDLSPGPSTTAGTTLAESPDSNTWRQTATPVNPMTMLRPTTPKVELETDPERLAVEARELIDQNRLQEAEFLLQDLERRAPRVGAELRAVACLKAGDVERSLQHLHQAHALAAPERRPILREKISRLAAHYNLPPPTFTVAKADPPKRLQNPFAPRSRANPRTPRPQRELASTAQQTRKPTAAATAATSPRTADSSPPTTGSTPPAGSIAPPSPRTPVQTSSANPAPDSATHWQPPATNLPPIGNPGQPTAAVPPPPAASTLQPPPSNPSVEPNTDPTIDAVTPPNAESASLPPPPQPQPPAQPPEALPREITTTGPSTPVPASEPGPDYPTTPPEPSEPSPANQATEPPAPLSSNLLVVGTNMESPSAVSPHREIWIISVALQSPDGFIDPAQVELRPTCFDRLLNPGPGSIRALPSKASSPILPPDVQRDRSTANLHFGYFLHEEFNDRTFHGFQAEIYYRDVFQTIIADTRPPLTPPPSPPSQPSQPFPPSQPAIPAPATPTSSPSSSPETPPTEPPADPQTALLPLPTPPPLDTIVPNGPTAEPNPSVYQVPPPRTVTALEPPSPLPTATGTIASAFPTPDPAPPESSTPQPPPTPSKSPVAEPSPSPADLPQRVGIFGLRRGPAPSLSPLSLIPRAPASAPEEADTNPPAGPLTRTTPTSTTPPPAIDDLPLAEGTVIKPVSTDAPPEPEPQRSQSPEPSSPSSAPEEDAFTTPPEPVSEIPNLADLPIVRFPLPTRNTLLPTNPSPIRPSSQRTARPVPPPPTTAAPPPSFGPIRSQPTTSAAPKPRPKQQSAAIPLRISELSFLSSNTTELSPAPNERRRIDIQLQVAPNTRIDPEKISTQSTFYDKAQGRDDLLPCPSIIDTPRLAFRPSGSAQILTISLTQRVNQAGRILPGQRYHGHTITIAYDGKLQARVNHPESLRSK